MKFSRTGSRLLQLVCALSLVFTVAACGSGGSDGGGGTPSAASPSTGTFVDSPVQGLGYICAPSGLSGVTNASGQYNFFPGDTVTFTLYGRAIGTAVPAGPVVTALSVFSATSLTDPQVVNLSQLLLTLAGGPPASGNPIVVPPTAPAGFPATIDFSAPGFDTSFPGLTLVSEATATTHLGTSFKTLDVTLVNSGTVTSNPSGMNCTIGTCSAVFQTGTVVTLTATGTGFTGWSGGTGSASCTGTGTCAVTLNADSTVTATFPVAPPPATLTIDPNPGTGTGQVQCSTGGAFGPCAASYPNGTTLTLRGVANSGSTFTGLSNGTGMISCTGTADCSTILTADSSVTATFTLNVTNFSVTAFTATTTGGGGTVQCSANGGAAAACGSYPVGSSIVMTATPNAASNFTGWTGAGCRTGACSFTLTANTTVTANFNRPTLSVTVVGTGTVHSNPIGILDCTTLCFADFNRGTVVSLTVVSGTGFSGWSGACSGIGTCDVTLTDNSSVTATFGGIGLPPFALEAYMKASNTGADDQFGRSVALAGDTLAVGVPFEDSAATGVNGDQANSNAQDSGAVYVFTRTNGVWSQQAYIKASNTGVGDLFGMSVALSGDTLAVGASGEEASSGAVYVFTRTNGVWTQQAYLKASNPEGIAFMDLFGDQFGWSVALEGDTLAVGALGENSAATGVNGDQVNNNAQNSGAVYVFTRTNGVWSQQAYLKASNTGADDLFGMSVALDGDTLAVGAIDEDSAAPGVNGDQANNSEPGSGAVYVFTRTNGVWSQQAYVKPFNPTAQSRNFRFGISVGLAGDTLAVGAYSEYGGGPGGSGAAYVFTRTSGVWSPQAYLKASNMGFNDKFGWSVALSGDTLAVGAIDEDSAASGVNGDQANNSATDSGAVYIFTRTAGLWTQQAYVKASNTGADDQFGRSVAVEGDTLAVGAWQEGSAAAGINGNQADNSAPGSGAVYVYRAQ